MRERERDATQTASMNQALIHRLKANEPPTNYSPLRSKTPPADVRANQDADAHQLQN